MAKNCMVPVAIMTDPALLLARLAVVAVLVKGLLNGPSYSSHGFALSEHKYLVFFMFLEKKSRIRETPTLSTDADSRTDTNLKRLRDFIFFNFFF